METLVVLGQQRYARQQESHNQYCSGGDFPSPGFDSPSTASFREINCRTFHAGPGILPSPFMLPPNNSSSGIKQVCSFSQSSQFVTASHEKAGPSKNSKNVCAGSKQSKRSNSVPINFHTCKGNKHFSDDFSNSFKDTETDLFSSSPNSELWAGPAYSNSPPPSSLPIPKFSLRQKRSVSLDFPAASSGISLTPVAKSAPPSPSREPYSTLRDTFFSPASATKNLRRILHLDTADD